MPAGTLRVIAQVGDVNIDATASRDCEGSIGHQGELPAGKAGTLGTRTDNNTGVATLSTGHGVQSADKIDVFWAGGSRYGMDVTVDGNAVTVDGGGGDNLPAQSTAVVVTKRVPIAAAFDGDDVKLIAVCCKTKRIRFTFEDSGGSALLSRDLPAGEPWSWVSDQGVTNPLAGASVAAIQAANGESDAAGTIQVAAKTDSM